MIIPGDPSQIEDGAVTIALVEAVAGNGTGPRESGVPADNGTDHTHGTRQCGSTPTLQLLYHDPTRFHGGGILWLAWSPEYGIGVIVLVPAMTHRNIN